MNDDKWKIERVFHQVEQGQTDFILTELETAITFCDVARSTSDSERRARNIANADKGYQTALHFLQTVNHDLKNSPAFQETLAYLEHLLGELR
jgi:hypothetical protein